MSNQKRRTVLKSVGGVAVIGTLAGCTGGGNGGNETNDPEVESAADGEDDSEPSDASLRVAHLSPDAPNVDVYVDGDVVLEDVAFRTVSDYLELPSGTYDVEITAADDEDTVVFDDQLDVSTGHFTVAAIGELADESQPFSVEVFEDDLSDPGDMARVRAIHAAPDAPGVTITAAETGSALFEDLRFGEAQTSEVPPGDYTLEVRPASADADSDPVAAFTVSLEAGVYSALAVGYLAPDDAPADEPFDLQVVGDSDQTENVEAEPVMEASLRVAHLSPDAPNVDVYIDGDAVLEDIPYRTVSDYLELNSGTYDVEITAAGDKETVVFDDELDVPAGDITVAAVGELADENEPFGVEVYEDDLSDPDDQTRLRFIHASPDAPNVDITEHGDVLFEDVAFGEASSIEVDPDEYDLEVRPATEDNDGHVVETFHVETEGGVAYSAFAVGYLAPDDAPADEEFDLEVVADTPGAEDVEAEPEMDASLRVAHLSPDAPNVDVYIDGDAVLEDVPYRTVSDYLELKSGTYDVEITAADDKDTVVFDDELDVPEGDITVAALGELADENQSFEIEVYEDDLSDPGDHARLRFIHASPDAPSVDITEHGDVLFEDVAFSKASSIEVDPDDYDLEVRPATDDNDGDVVDTFHVGPDDEAVYTTFAVGYLDPDEAPADEAFDLELVVDSEAA